MPSFRRKETSERVGAIPRRELAKYRRFLDRIPRDNVAYLQFSPKEDMDLGRRALLRVAATSRKYIKISKVPGRRL